MPTPNNTSNPKDILTQDEMNRVISNAAFLPWSKNRPQVSPAPAPAVQLSTDIDVPDEPLDAPEEPMNLSPDPVIPRMTPEGIYAGRAARKREATNSIYQDLLNARKDALVKDRTNNARLAAFNALGNALRTMAQPVGWAAGGATSGVQPYDNRQYLEAFNRAVKAGEDLRNLGTAEMQYRLKQAEQDERMAQSMSEYGRKLAAQLANRNKTETQKRQTIALRAYYDLIKSDSIHKGGYPSFSDFIRLNGYGEDLFGDWSPSDEEVVKVVGAFDGGKPDRSSARKTGDKGEGDKGGNDGRVDITGEIGDNRSSGGVK